MENMVSVIIPTFRRPDMLKTAIQSVNSQDYRNIEIIVIDDNSGDNTSEVVKEFENVRYYCNEENEGPGSSRKKGYLLARGDYIVFLDDDDYYTDETFFSTAIELIQRKNYVFVSGNVRTLEVKTGRISASRMNVSGEIDALEYLKGFTVKYNKPTSTFSTVFSKCVLDSVGFQNMSMMNDVAIYLRSFCPGKVYVLDEFIGIYRIHEANISKTVSAEFIIENLKEKKPVYEKIKNNQFFLEYEKWWLDQVNNTVSYYVYSTLPSFTNYKKVRDWCIQNSNNRTTVKRLLKRYDEFIWNYWVSELKMRIKRILRMN